MSNTDFTPKERQALHGHPVWPRFLAFPVLALGGQIAFFAGLSGDSWPVQALWIIGLTYCWYCIGGVTHELAHQTLPIPAAVSLWCGRLIGTFLGLPYSVYRAVHIRHHAYLNTPLDFELWPYCDPRCGIWFRRAFVWFDILCGFIATPLIYQRILTARESPVLRAERRQMRNEYVYVLLFWGTVTAALIALHLTGTWRPRLLDLLRASPLLLAASANSLRKLVEHLGLASYDPVGGTRTIIGAHWWTRLLSYFDFDLPIHGPHHRYPKRPHHQLESSMREIEERHPEQAYPKFSSFSAALRDVLPWLFQNPAVGINAGNTAPLTHLPHIDNFTTDALHDVVQPTR